MVCARDCAEGDADTVCRYLSCVSWGDAAVGRLLSDGVESVKEAGVEHGSNRAALRYEITNRSRREAVLQVTPFYQFVPKGKDTGEAQRT